MKGRVGEGESGRRRDEETKRRRDEEIKRLGKTATSTREQCY
jgi:hypothetical protein